MAKRQDRGGAKHTTQNSLAGLDERFDALDMLSSPHETID